MDKAAFLVHLRKNISMLDDDEQKDIVDEYSQHIDMKVAEGMSEEEAIEDFGDFEDFVREVLSAYHVKAPFDQLPAVGEDGASASVPSGAATMAGEVADGIAQASADAAGKILAIAKDGTRRLGKTASDVFARGSARIDAAIRERVSSTEGAAGAEGSEQGSGLDGGGDVGSRWGLIGMICGACRKICVTGVRWMWNVAVACVIAGMGLLSLMCLFGFGLGVVLLVQGYPVLGLTILAAGASACSMACAYLISRLIARKRTIGASRSDSSSPEPPARDSTAPEPSSPVPPVRTPLREADSMDDGQDVGRRPAEVDFGTARRGDADGSDPTSVLADETRSMSHLELETDPTLPFGSRGGAYHA